MKVKVKLNARQIFDDKEDEEEHICDGEIEYLKNGTILKFTEKFENQELNFKLTILQNKILIDRQNEIMTLDYKLDDNCRIDTPYGSMNMTVHTKEIKVEKEEELIKTIILRYQITLENDIQYDNIVTIAINYFK